MESSIIFNIIFPFSILDSLWLAPLALLLDLALGDPALPWPHPVCLIGRALDFLEAPVCKYARLAQKFPGKEVTGKIPGALCLLLCAAGSWLLVMAACNLPIIGPFFALYIAWAGLAAGCLLDTGKIVLARIETGSITEGREAMSWLVTRDTSQMDKNSLRKTLADTMSENFTDAFVAPFFWLLFLGPAGLWIYKTVSTFDSRWGYLTEKWAASGWAGARADDLLAWLPARLAPFLLWACHGMHRFIGHAPWLGCWPGYAMIRKQARTMTSPNSGWAMAACAWLCNGRMAGPDRYFGAIVQKGWLGPDIRDAKDWTETRLSALFSLIRLAVAEGGLIMWLFALGLVLLF